MKSTVHPHAAYVRMINALKMKIICIVEEADDKFRAPIFFYDQVTGDNYRLTFEGKVATMKREGATLLAWPPGSSQACDPVPGQGGG